MNVDPDGLGPAGFGERVFVTTRTSAGSISSPRSRTARSTPSRGWLGTAPAGRITARLPRLHPREKNESDNTDIFVRHSDDGGATWSPPVRVNDDGTTNSQFLPKISLDPTTGNIAVVWYDSRADLGGGGPATPTACRTTTRSSGARSATTAAFPEHPDQRRDVELPRLTERHRHGDYSGLSFFGGIAHPAWSDNSNSTGNNPDGTLNEFDLYTATVSAP